MRSSPAIVLCIILALILLVTSDQTAPRIARSGSLQLLVSPKAVLEGPLIYQPSELDNEKGTTILSIKKIEI
jgi:hypothetical protein